MRTMSFVLGKHAVNLGDVFAVLETIGEHSERERLRFRDGLFPSGTVSEHSR